MPHNPNHTVLTKQEKIDAINSANAARQAQQSGGRVPQSVGQRVVDNTANRFTSLGGLASSISNIPGQVVDFTSRNIIEPVANAFTAIPGNVGQVQQNQRRISAFAPNDPLAAAAAEEQRIQAGLPIPGANAVPAASPTLSGLRDQQRRVNIDFGTSPGGRPVTSFSQRGEGTVTLADVQRDVSAGNPGGGTLSVAQGRTADEQAAIDSRVSQINASTDALRRSRLESQAERGGGQARRARAELQRLDENRFKDQANRVSAFKAATSNRSAKDTSTTKGFNTVKDLFKSTSDTSGASLAVLSDFANANAGRVNRIIAQRVPGANFQVGDAERDVRSAAFMLSLFENLQRINSANTGILGTGFGADTEQEVFENAVTRTARSFL